MSRFLLYLIASMCKLPVTYDMSLVVCDVVDVSVSNDFVAGHRERCFSVLW